MNTISSNMEKYMALTLGINPAFIDSFQYVSLSLDKLVINLPKE